MSLGVVNERRAIEPLEELLGREQNPNVRMHLERVLKALARDAR